MFARLSRRFQSTNVAKLQLFNTFDMVAHLEREGKFSRQQSIAIMRALGASLRFHSDAAHQRMILKDDAEREHFSYKVALHELRTELSTLRKTETASLQSTNASIHRDLDILSLKFNEDFNVIKNDLQLEMNNRKTELREERQKNEIHLQEINHRLSILLGEVKTEVESMKLQLITKWASGIALTATTAVIIGLKFY